MIFFLLVAFHNVGQIGVLGQVGKNLLVLTTVEDKGKFIVFEHVRGEIFCFWDVFGWRE